MVSLEQSVDSHTQHVAAVDENAMLADLENLSNLSIQKSDLQIGDGTVVKAPKLLAELKRSLSDLTESLCDIQSTLYEIQEHRHASNNGSSTKTTPIDTLLPSFDHSLELFSVSISTLTNNISDYVSSISPSTPGPLTPGGGASGSRTVKELDKRLKELQRDWAEMVESDAVLKEELKEDKWLEVFRTASDQAEGMMDSLQKAVSQCSTLAFQIMAPAGFRASLDGEGLKSTISNYEAKKKFYQPSVTKSLMILEKGIRERITKNGETLRRHADMSDRWRSLKDEMALIDKQIPDLRTQISYLSSVGDGSTEMLMDEQEDTGDSSILGLSIISPRSRTVSGLPNPREFDRRPEGPSSPFTAGEVGMTNARSMARNKPRSSSGLSGLMGVSSPSFTATGSSKVSDSPVVSTPASPQSEASSYFSNLRNRFTRKGARTPTPTGKPKWNSSSRIIESPTPPSGNGAGEDRVAFSRKKSMGFHDGGSRGGSRSPSPSAGRSVFFTGRRASDHTPTTANMFGKTVQPPITSDEHPHPPTSPTFSSVSSSTTPNRRRSMLPVLKSTPSSGSTATGARLPSQTSISRGPPPPPLPPMPDMKEIAAKEAKAAYLRSGMMTPEPMLRDRATQMPFYNGRPQGSGIRTPSRMSNAGQAATTPGRSVSTPARPNTPGRATPSRERSSMGPPSAFKEPSRPSSRAASRAGASTPSGHLSTATFVPNRLDLLDMAIYDVLQSIPNDIGVERLDPPLRRGQLHVGEWKGEYVFMSGRVGRRTVGCRLLELNKPGQGGVMRKVMVRVNGVWVDLRFYILELA